MVALVDDEDYDRVAQYTWWPAKQRTGNFYAAARLAPGHGPKTLLHKLIMPGPFKLDHKDGDGLNCQKTNLREATDAENQRNTRRARGARQRPLYKGVKPTQNHPNAWRASVYLEGRNRHLGVFTTPEEAAKAYDRAAREHFGEFARTNFTEEK